MSSITRTASALTAPPNAEIWTWVVGGVVGWMLVSGLLTLVLVAMARSSGRDDEPDGGTHRDGWRTRSGGSARWDGRSGSDPGADGA